MVAPSTRFRSTPPAPSKQRAAEETRGLSLKVYLIAGLVVVVVLLLSSIMVRTRITASEDDNINGTTTTTLPAEDIPAPSTLNDSEALPEMIVFDLDYTLWPFWVDTHISGPLRGTKDGLLVRDRWGEACGFYNDVAGVLHHIKRKGIVLGVASRSSAPDLARSMLSLLRIPIADQEEGSSARTAMSLFDYMEIYPGSKKKHFRKLAESSGIAYEEMLFFDDESRNREVESLGVTMRLVRDGVTRAEIDKGVEEWRRRNQRGQEIK